MANLQKLIAWNKERKRRSIVTLLLMAILIFPTYLIVTLFTSNHDDAEFLTFLVVIIISISFGPLVSYFLGKYIQK